MTTISKDQFKAQIRTLQDNLTVKTMAEAIGKATRNKELSSSILGMVSDKAANKSMDFSRCAELLSQTTFNKNWNQVSAMLSQEPVSQDAASCAESASCAEEYKGYSARALHQQMLGMIEYHDDVYMVGSNGITYTRLEGDLEEICEDLYFESSETDNSVSGYFSITVNLRSGEIVDWETGCSEIGNIIKEASALDAMTGKVYDGIKRDFSPKTYIAYRTVGTQHLLLKIFCDSEISVDDFWDEIGEDTKGVCVCLRDKVRDQFAWNNAIDLPHTYTVHSSSLSEIGLIKLN